MISDNRIFSKLKQPGTQIPGCRFMYAPPKAAVLQGAFRFAVFPKRLLSYNPMQYVVMWKKQESYELFSDDNSDELDVPTITYEQYVAMADWLKKKNNLALLPIQIAYFIGLRIG